MKGWFERMTWVPLRLWVKARANQCYNELSCNKIRCRRPFPLTRNKWMLYLNAYILTSMPAHMHLNKHACAHAGSCGYQEEHQGGLHRRACCLPDCYSSCGLVETCMCMYVWKNMLVLCHETFVCIVYEANACVVCMKLRHAWYVWNPMHVLHVWN